MRTIKTSYVKAGDVETPSLASGGKTMKSSVDDLVRRQAAILAEIRNLDMTALEFLANLSDTDLGSDDEARRLLRGLIRSGDITPRDDLGIYMAATGEEGILPALPGLFLIDLMPLPSGGFDRKRILKTPVIAWKVERSGYSVPVIPGLPIADRWAVLTPDGFVIADQYTSLSGLYPLELNDWIKSEIEWAEDPRNAASDFWTSSQKLLQYSGPLARAVWRMMATRRNWVGRPEEMLEIISEFREDKYDNTLPAKPAALLAGLDELHLICADAGLSINRSDDGRLIVTRLAYEEVIQSLLSPLQ